MPTDIVNEKELAIKDMTWNVLIKHAEAEIRACQKRIKALRKSCIFFKKQDDSGIPYPVTEAANPVIDKELS